MNLRLANRNDANQLAQLHELSSAKQPGGFMFRLGRAFLSQYYRALIDEGSCIILCATDASDKLIGFVAGSLDAKARLTALKRNRFRLLVASLPAFIRHPSLMREVYVRQNAGSADESEMGFVVQSGAHEEFWAWLPDHGSGAIELHLKWLSLMRLLGARTISGEVDKVNDVIVRAHRMLGARVIREFTTPDGRERLLIQYQLKA
jgi:hypothetical protein